MPIHPGTPEDSALTSPPKRPVQHADAANVARQQAENIYQHNPPNQLNGQRPDNPYFQTHQPTFDWQEYHTAWQQYYQQYYHRYYSQQLLDLQSKQTEQPQTITGGDDSWREPTSRFQQVRADLVKKVGERAKKIRKSPHLIPIISALVVGSLFIFLQYNRVFAAKIESLISPGSTVDVSDTIISDPSANADVGDDPKLIIPKINVNVPVVYTVKTIDDNAVQAALENGVVHYNLAGANSVPGQKGNTVVLGHSSNDVFDPGEYKFAFVLLDKLENGDLFYMNYEGKRYIYKVYDKKIIDPANWQALQQNNGKPTAVLVTCTPAGTANHRLLVFGEQVSPDPAAASTQPKDKQDSNPAEIPGNSPTFFERIRDLLF